MTESYVVINIKTGWYTGKQLQVSWEEGCCPKPSLPCCTRHDRGRKGLWFMSAGLFSINEQLVMQTFKVFVLISIKSNIILIYLCLYP